MLAINTWTQMLWEKISTYGIEVSLNCPKMKHPRGSQDTCIMEMLVKYFGMAKKDLIHFNRVCKYQQATFLSDTTITKGEISTNC